MPFKKNHPAQFNNWETFIKLFEQKPVNLNCWLGPLPWDKEHLKREYFRNFRMTREAIKLHPGFEYNALLTEHERFLQIFSNAVNDLLLAIENFDKACEDPSFHMRKYQARFDQYINSVNSNLILSASIALALVECSRRINKKFEINEYEEKINQKFSSNEKHRFIQDLRNGILHGKLLTPNWRVTYGQKKQSHFLFTQDVLLKTDKWSNLALNFISHHADGIDIYSLFKEYHDSVMRFHEWVSCQIFESKKTEIIEYQYYEKLLNSFSTKSAWLLILKQAVQKNVNPYDYLENYFTKEELREILRFPNHSKAQIDKIIEIGDEYEACDDEVYQLICKLFKVDQNHK